MPSCHREGLQAQFPGAGPGSEQLGWEDRQPREYKREPAPDWMGSVSAGRPHLPAPDPALSPGAQRPPRYLLGSPDHGALSWQQRAGELSPDAVRKRWPKAVPPGQHVRTAAVNSQPLFLSMNRLCFQKYLVRRAAPQHQRSGTRCAQTGQCLCSSQGPWAWDTHSGQSLKLQQSLAEPEWKLWVLAQAPHRSSQLEGWRVE